MRGTNGLIGLLLLGSRTAVPLSAGSLKSEVSWISELEGVALTASQDSGTRLENVYTVSGAPSVTLSSIRNGLREHGWKLKTAATVEAAGADVSGIEATKNGMELDLTVQNLGPVTSIALDLKAGAGSASTSSTSTATVSSSGTVATTTTTSSSSKPASTTHAVKAGHELVINDNKQTQTYDCSDTDVILNGNDDDITLLGTCSTLTINGNRCHVAIKARIADVVVNGDNCDVKWWAEKNPEPPDVTDNGDDNSVSEVKE